jgi:methylated-DNA-protein-cysteine methyltransferase-like protein
MLDPVYQKIYALVRRIPKGRVATYGQIARLAGIGPQPRRVGYALGILSDEDGDVPWQRVVNAKGEISARWDPDAIDRQRSLLLEEGIQFDAKGRIDLTRFSWQEAARHRSSHDRLSRRPVI